jgi:voltage-gated potassium channel
MIKYITEISQHTLTRVVIAITFFALIGASLVFFFEGSVNKEFEAMGDSIWWVLVTMTTVGYGDKVPITIGGRVIGIIIMFLGLALLSSFTATISSFFIAKKIKEGRGLEEIKLKNHLIICGWNFSAEQILSRLENNKKKMGSVVLINQLNEENIADIIHRFSSLKIKFVRGDFSKEVVLNRANIRLANTAVIFPDSSSGLGSQSDERTILATLTIKSINSKIKVFAYIIDRENLSHIRKAKADEVLISDDYAGYLMASHILTPGVPQAVHQLLSEDGLYKLSRKEIPTAFYGKTYAELTDEIRSDQSGIALGLGREQEGMDISNILSDDYSYLDQFIRRKFEEAGRGLSEENRINIQINPLPETILDSKDFLLLISKGDTL